MNEKETGSLRDPEQDLAGTTHDVSKDASEAVRRFNEEQSQRLNASHSYPVIDGAKATLRINIQGAAAPVLLTVEGDTTIGRRDPMTMETPEFDLTAYGGYQLGISRNHALLRINDKRIEIVDLGSRNGTYIDGTRLTAHQPHPVYDGAELRLGKITMTLYIQQGG